MKRMYWGKGKCTGTYVRDWIMTKHVIWEVSMHHTVEAAQERLQGTLEVEIDWQDSARPCTYCGYWWSCTDAKYTDIHFAVLMLRDRMYSTKMRSMLFHLEGLRPTYSKNCWYAHNEKSDPQHLLWYKSDTSSIKIIGGCRTHLKNRATRFCICKTLYVLWPFVQPLTARKEWQTYRGLRYWWDCTDI